MSLIGDRAEVLARVAKKQYISATDFGAVQLKQIASNLSKTFWTDDKKSLLIMSERVQKILENFSKQVQSWKRKKLLVN